MTSPNYFYFKTANKRYHRLNFTHKKLVKQGNDPSLTEREIMSNLGWDRIFDAGHKRWMWYRDEQR